MARHIIFFFLKKIRFLKACHHFCRRREGDTKTATKERKEESVRARTPTVSQKKKKSFSKRSIFQQGVEEEGEEEGPQMEPLVRKEEDSPPEEPPEDAAAKA